MTAEEFIAIIGLIQGAYPSFNRFRDDDVKDVWYECLNDLEYANARKAALNAIKTTKDFPPDIATIREEYGRLVEIENHELGEIKRFFQQTRAYYPGSGELWNGFDVWQKRAKNARDAETFYKVVTQYVNECDRKGQDCLDFVRCLETITRDESGKISFKESAR